MPLKKTNYKPLLLLPVIVLVCLALWLFQRTPFTYIISETGSYDLRGLDFTSEIANVRRTVEYVPGVLLTPEEFNARDDILIGTIPEDLPVATMRIRILLPDDTMQYGISGYSMNYASDVYVNGKWLLSDGRPGYSLTEESAREFFHLYSAEPHKGEIEIVIATSAFSHKDTSSGMEWCIGEYQNIRTYYAKYTLAPIVVLAWYVLLALVFLLLLLTLPAYRVNGWLMLLALVMALRTGFSQSKPLFALFPQLEWGLGFRIEKMCDPLMAILLLLVFSFEFPGLLSKWLQRTLIGVSAAIAIPYLFLNTHTLSYFSAANRLLVYILLVVMSVLPMLVLVRKKAPLTLPQKIMLGGIAMVLFAALWDLNYYGSNPLNAPFALIQPVMVIFSMFMLVSAMLTTLQKNTEAETEADKLRMATLEQEAELTNARTAIMLSQIQPHFLYNALNTIGGMCDADPELAQETVFEFAGYLRANMDSLSSPDLVPFEKELHHVKTYLALEKKRFTDRLIVEYDIQTSQFFLPPLTLQPIVENAVLHGITTQRRKGTVLIRTEVVPEGVKITVADDGVGYDTSVTLDPIASADAGRGDRRSHLGIQNVRSRLAALCGGTLTVDSSLGEGTTVTILVPQEEGSTE